MGERSANAAAPEEGQGDGGENRGAEAHSRMIGRRKEEDLFRRPAAELPPAIVRRVHFRERRRGWAGSGGGGHEPSLAPWHPCRGGRYAGEGHPRPPRRVLRHPRVAGTIRSWVPRPRLFPLNSRGILVSTEDTLGGSVRFRGTRVPVQALIDTLDGGSLDEFLDGWPDVTREQAEAVIRWEQNQARRVFDLPSAA